MPSLDIALNVESFSRKTGKTGLFFRQISAVFRGFCLPMSTQGLSINMFILLYLR
jgi:hypothetical protein